MSCRSLIAILASLAYALPAMGADLVERIGYVRFETLPLDFDFTVDGSNGTFVGDDSYQSSFGLAVGGRWSFAGAGNRHGLLIGLEGAALAADLDPGGSRTAIEGRAYLGWGYAASPRWTLAAVARAGYGMARLDLDAVATGGASASGDGLSFGGEATASYALAPGVRLGLALGWRSYEAELSGDQTRIVLEEAGPTAALSLEFALPLRPGGVE